MFLECAKHTIQQDWLLGMAYLFCIEKNEIKKIHESFKELPQTTLYIQTAMYYCCLELYKSLHRDSENLHLFDCLSLMQRTINVAHKSTNSDIFEALKYWGERLFKLHGIKGTNLFDSNQVTKDNNEGEDHEKKIEYHNVFIQKSGVTTGESKGVVSTENLQRDKSDGIEDNLLESDDKNDIDWTDECGNFSDEDITDNAAHKRNALDEELYVEHSISLLKDISECSTEKERFEGFEKVFHEIRNIDLFHGVKKILLQWPKFVDHEYTKIDKHPVFKMMKIVNIHIAENDKNKNNRQVFQEYKELIEALPSTNVSL